MILLAWGSEPRRVHRLAGKDTCSDLTPNTGGRASHYGGLSRGRSAVEPRSITDPLPATLLSLVNPSFGARE